MVFKHNKRPFGDDESCQLAYRKHQKQLDYSSQIAAFVEIVPCNNIPQKLCFPAGEGEERFTKTRVEDTNLCPTILEPPITADKQLESARTSVVPSVVVNDSWLPSISREDAKSSAALHVLHSPVLHEYHRDDIYSTLLDYHPRKPVSIGLDHQADIPSWDPDGTTSSLGHVGMPAPATGADSDNGVAFCPNLDLVDNGDYMEMFKGICIIPMPGADMLAGENREAGCGRIDCLCLDHGSIRCVKQHIAEEREKLKIKLGGEKFMELGFGEMGEEVAGKWSVEDEQVFQEVVYSNPMSRNKNFWEQLTLFFPSRSKKELVSYYFNVFVLQRRAEQNRLCPFNVDSDDDEWQGSDNEELAMTEEDEDSVVESPAMDNQDDLDHDDGDNQEYHYGIDNDDEDSHGDDADTDANDDVDGDNENDDDDGGVDDVSEEHDQLFDRSCSVGPTVQPKDKNVGNVSVDQDVQDDSCMSYECHHNRDDPSNPADVAGRWPVLVEGDEKQLSAEYLNDNSGCMAAHGYVVEPCDPKVWDIGFLAGPMKDLDFLPTCNMIEEVFGEEAWNNDSLRDGPGIS